MKLKTGSNLLLVGMLAVVTIILATGWYASSSTQREVYELVDDSIVPRSSMTHAYNTAVVSTQNVQLAGSATDASSRNENLDLAQKRLSESKQSFDTYVKLRSKLSPQAAADAQANLRVVQPTWDVIEKSIAEIKSTQGASRTWETQGPVALQAFGRMMFESQTKYEQNYTHNVDQIEQTVQVTIIAYAVGFALMLLMVATMYWAMRKNFFRPLGMLDQHFGKMAGGDLREKISFSSKNEIGDIFESLRRMQSSLSDIVLSVRDGVNEVTGDTDLISNGSMDLSARTEQQSAALQETASSMQELSSTVSQNADNAKQADSLAASAQEVASRGGNIMENVIDRMGVIAENSRRISEIVNMIDSIAFQTNILALNAAVEAARAGEQGKGFAVVASEVRNLASRSAQAAKEIKALIETAVQEVSGGNALVEEAGKTMKEIVVSVSRVTDIMSEIASASNEQANGIGQINQAVSQMDEVTHRNALLVQETAAASNNLKQSMVKVNSAISRLRIDQSSSSILAVSEPVIDTPVAAPVSRPVASPAPVKPVPALQAPAKPKAVLTHRAEPTVAKPTKAKGSEIVSPLKGNSSDEGSWEEF